MLRFKVDSSMLASVGYVYTSMTLEVEFANGSVYRYDHVPPAIYDNLIGAESIGKYFAAYIRDQYPTTKIKEAS